MQFWKRQTLGLCSSCAEGNLGDSAPSHLPLHGAPWGEVSCRTRGSSSTRCILLWVTAKCSLRKSSPWTRRSHRSSMDWFWARVGMHNEWQAKAVNRGGYCTREVPLTAINPLGPTPFVGFVLWCQPRQNTLEEGRLSTDQHHSKNFPVSPDLGLGVVCQSWTHPHIQSSEGVSLQIAPPVAQKKMVIGTKKIIIKTTKLLTDNYKKKQGLEFFLNSWHNQTIS